ncbi:hypothetical protein EYF80_039978 [Liparis tanakae]|uniref:Uncharacterized protein n=1 Tax=Liparis tanakae TaxID=230148 RepID=A0A4Z2GAK4_9TELE|nr:hypothetical protein EYF80_039978 [Liparis tanakae]
MCKSLWRGEMFAVAVAIRCYLPGDPVQTRHRGIRPMAAAATAAAAPPLASPVEQGGGKGRVVVVVQAGPRVTRSWSRAGGRSLEGKAPQLELRGPGKCPSSREVFCDF